MCHGALIFGAEYFYYSSSYKHQILIFKLVLKRAFRKYILLPSSYLYCFWDRAIWIEKSSEKPKFPNLANTPLKIKIRLKKATKYVQNDNHMTLMKSKFDTW